MAVLKRCAIYGVLKCHLEGKLHVGGGGGCEGVRDVRAGPSIWGRVGGSM